MPAGEALEDDYIISLLKKDADDHKKRYSTIGNGPLLSTAKRRPDAPKPNTRFLKNIIRETDSHNAALKAKEEEESRVRLRKLREDAQSGKRKRDDVGDVRDGKRRKERESRPGRWASALGLDGTKDSKTRGEERGYKHNSRRPRENVNDGDPQRGTHRHRHRRERHEEERSERRHRKSRYQDRSRSNERSRSPHHRKEHRTRHRSRSASPKRDPERDSPSESDPLTEFLGPRPPTQTLPRGRGAFKPSAMDSRFREGYNPSTDVALDHGAEEDDWDMALEALKARTKWRTQGADRLRAAGFTEDEIQRWEKSGNRGEVSEKDVEDVRWRKKGEGREWDRGKVVGEGGEVGVKAEWAR